MRTRKEALHILNTILATLKLKKTLLHLLSVEQVIKHEPISPESHFRVLNTFMLEKTILYSAVPRKGESESLFACFKNDFGNWTRNQFSRTYGKIHLVLKKTLRKRGAWQVGKGPLDEQLFWLSRPESILKRNVRDNSPSSIIGNSKSAKVIEVADLDDEDKQDGQDEQDIQEKQYELDGRDKQDQQDLQAKRNDKGKHDDQNIKHNDVVHNACQAKQLSIIEDREMTENKSSPNITQSAPDSSPHTNTIGPEHFVRFVQIWSKEYNYTGDLFECLDDTLIALKWTMDILEIHSSHWSICFRYILGGAANRYAWKTFKKGWTFDQMVKSVRNHFENSQKKDRLRLVWTNTTFESEEKMNPTKSKAEILDLLITKLQKCQSLLGEEYASEVHMIDCLFRACRDVPELIMACPNIPQDFESIRALFHRALDVYPKFQSAAPVYFVGAEIVQMRSFRSARYRR